MTTIAIDARMINHSGIGTYIKNLTPYIIKRFPDIEFLILGNTEELKQLEIQNFNNVKLVNLLTSIYSMKEQIDMIKVTKKADLLWVPHYNIPVFWKKKLIVTVHDVFHLAFPSINKGFHKKLYAKLLFKSVSSRACRILTVSNFSKNEFQRLVSNNQNISVTYNGVNKEWYSQKEKKEDKPFPYLIYVGNVKPHKNLISLLKAFEILKNKIPHKLIIVGKKEGFLTGDVEVEKYAEKLKDRVFFTGYISDEELRNYIVDADSLIFPSLYEGFGLPPVEAMACGCPTIVAKAAAIPEVCSDASVYFDPNDINDIADKIEKVVTNNEFKKILIKKGLKQAQNFTWEKCAENTIKVFEDVLSN